MNTARPSSNPILSTTLKWSALATVVLLLAGGIIGFAVDGVPGMTSALVAVALGMVLLAITALSILIANRWYGQPLYVQLFFAVVMGAWLLKFVIFIVALLVLRGQPWLHPQIFLVALVVSVLVSLVIDGIVMMRMRVPYVSDTQLPTTNPEEGGEESLPADNPTPRD